MADPRLNDDDIARARSYDDVAEIYEHVNAPLFFDEPARALVKFAEITRGERVLDVGAGTGAVSRAVIAAGADVVALDPSVPMLLAAGRSGVCDLVGGSVPNLPFLDAVFDGVCSAFVITHIDNPEGALDAMRRVLRKGGRVALSAWSPNEDPYSAAWSEVAHEFADKELISETAQRVLPGEPRFSREDGLVSLLSSCGFRVRHETYTFEFAMSIDAMISSREASASGRALRLALSDAQWSAYQERARDVLGRKFPGGIRFPRRVFFAAGHI